MKTEKSFLPEYNKPPLKVIDTGTKVSSHLKAIKGEVTEKKPLNSVIVNKIVNDPSAWDTSWFSNYE